MRVLPSRSGFEDFFGWWCCLVVALVGQGLALGQQLGDVDGDGVATVRDVARVTGHVNGTQPLLETEIPVADVTGDGAVNQEDVDAIVFEILGTRETATLPLSTVRFSSPEPGEDDVAVTRETVVHFTVPLALGTALDTSDFWAEFGGEKILSRVELSGDRRKATLFYLEPLPSSARVRVFLLDDGGLMDILGRPVDLDGDREPGGMFRMGFDTLSITPSATTAIVGRVFASEPGQGGNGNPVDVPLAGVTVTVDGAEESLRAVTDGQGNFTLSPCPSGAFFVKVDGRTSPQSSYPAGDYYPVVGKAWYAEAGKTDNLAGGNGTIFLPCVCAGSLQTVSPTEKTTVTFPQEVLDDFPQLAGTEIVVPANSLFGDDGTRGGMVGIAPVAPERLPEPLPDGLEFPLVLTIQTDGGTNFDQPVPVCFPNLPDPETGVALAPGEKSALWSFDHDEGIWSVAGSMTVTADGVFVKTDPGVGVREPGWHGSLPGSQGHGDGPVELPEDAEDIDEDGDGEPDDPFDPDDPDDEDEAECRGPSGVDVTVSLYKQAKEIVSCALNVLPLTKNIRCAIDMAFNAGDILTQIVDMGKLLNNPENVGAVKLALSLVKTAKGIMASVESCVQAFNPASMISTVVSCANNIAKIITELCGLAKEQPGDPEKCKLDPTTQSGCDIAQTIAFMTGTLKNLVKDADPKKLFIEVICAGIDFLDDLLGFITGVAGSPPEGGDKGKGKGGEKGDGEIEEFTPEQVEMLREAIAAIEEPTTTLVAAAASFSDVEEYSNELVVQSCKQQEAISKAVAKIGKPAGGRSHYAIEFLDGSGVVARGTVRPKGDINRIMPVKTAFKIHSYNHGNGCYDSSPSMSVENGRRFNLPVGLLEKDPANETDTDGDGIPDVGEFVVGTDPALADTDGDGITDGAELDNGTDPGTATVSVTGVVASAPGTGTAEDVCAVNNLAVTANGVAGVSVYNVFSGLNPTRIAEVNTPGSAVAVACFGGLIAVADTYSGLAIIDISDPADVRLVRQVGVGDSALSVTAAGPTAYVGTQGGKVVAVDLPTGKVLGAVRAAGGGAVHDLGVSGETLYVVQAGRLSTVDLEAGVLAIANSVALPGATNPRRRHRVFAGADVLYSTWRNGFNIFDIATDPQVPALVETVSTNQFGWKQIVANGSGLGIAAVSPNSTNDGPHHVNLYGVGADGLGSEFLLTVPTPGLAASVSVYNGRAYIADSRNGLQVINYRSLDTLGVAPTVALDSNVDLETALVEEGKLVRLTADVDDDVQVKNVRFFINDELVLIDGNFPFSHRFLAPVIADGGTFSVRAVAEDTGGNTATTGNLVLTLTPDATPPEVVDFRPRHGGLVGVVESVFVEFNEMVDGATVEDGGITVTSGGSDDQLGTGDDVEVIGEFSLREDSGRVFVDFAEALEPGVYRISVDEPTADLAGNLLAVPASVDFRVISLEKDDDFDGLPDDWELALGLDPDDDDSDGDGTLDGDEDFDNDGLPNGFEVLVTGTAPNVADTDGDGVVDGAEDGDFDGLTDSEEVVLGTDIGKIDSDGDGLDDLTESVTGSDPLDAGSGTDNRVASNKVVFTNAVPGAGPPLLEKVAVRSEAVAFTNSLSGLPPANLERVAVRSEAVSYQNALDGNSDLPATLPVSAATEGVSYQNDIVP